MFFFKDFYKYEEFQFKAVTQTSRKYDGYK